MGILGWGKGDSGTRVATPPTAAVGLQKRECKSRNTRAGNSRQICPVDHRPGGTGTNESETEVRD